MSQHTCGGTPNEDGRLSTDCNECYEQAWQDGFATGRRSLSRMTLERTQELVRNKFDPTKEKDEKKALELWRVARQVMETAQEVQEQNEQEMLEEQKERDERAKAEREATQAAPEPETPAQEGEIQEREESETR